MAANAAVHALADFFHMPDLQAFAKARFRTLALEYWKPALPHLPGIICAVFGTQGIDHPDLEIPVLDRCIGIYKNIIINAACLEAMDTYPIFSRALLKAVGKHLEDGQTFLISQNKQLSEDNHNLKLTTENQEYQISGMHSALRLVHKKLNNLILTQRGLPSKKGRGEISEKGDAAFKEEIESVIQILLPFVEAELAGMDGKSEWNKYL